LLRLEAAFEDRPSQPHITTAHSTASNCNERAEGGDSILHATWDPEIMLPESSGTRSFNQNHWRAIMQSAVSKACHAFVLI
jgi:hypothetical protein